MTYRRTPDRFTKRAHAEGFVARSVYKLEEIDRRTKLISRGMVVLDLGAAPGSWTQFLARRVGSAGRVIAVDREALRVPPAANVERIVADILEQSPESYVELASCAVVVSDMAPKASGIRDRDLAISYELSNRALEVARHALMSGGALLVKVFHGDGFVELRTRMRDCFDSVRVIKPEATRRESNESYLLATGFRR